MLQSINTETVYVNDTPFSVMLRNMTRDNLLSLHKSTMLPNKPADSFEANEQLVSFCPLSKPKKGETIFEFCQRLSYAGIVAQDFRLSNLLTDLTNTSLTIGQVAEDIHYREEHVLLTSKMEMVEDKKPLFAYEPYDLCFTAMPLSEYRKLEAAKLAQEKRIAVPAATVSMEVVQETVVRAKRTVQENGEPDVVEKEAPKGKKQRNKKEEAPKEKNQQRKPKENSNTNPWLKTHGLTGKAFENVQMLDVKKPAGGFGAVFRLQQPETFRPQMVALFNKGHVSEVITANRYFYVYIDFAAGKKRADVFNKYKALKKIAFDKTTGFGNALALLVKCYAPNLSDEQRATFKREFKKSIGIFEDEDDGSVQPMEQEDENLIFHPTSGSDDEEQEVEGSPSGGSDFDLPGEDMELFGNQEEVLTLKPASDEEIVQFEDVEVDWSTL